MSVEQNDVLRVTAETSIGDGDVQNVLHFRSTNVASVDDSTALGDMADIMDMLFDFMNLSITNDLTYDLVRVQNVTQDSLLGSAAWPNLTTGAGADDRLPDQVAGLITLPSATPKTRGGVYLGGFDEGALQGNAVLTAAALAQMVEFGAELLIEQVFGGASYRYVIFNRLLGTFVLPVAVIAHSVWRTQRRRRKTVGS